jgi:hypothetical protein
MKRARNLCMLFAVVMIALVPAGDAIAQGPTEEEIEASVVAGLARIPEFQASDGGFGHYSCDRVAHTGLAITMDVGHPTNVHPVDKQPVGDRLARWALSEIHDHDLVPTGPLYRSHQIRGDELILSFDHTGAGLITTDGESPRHFELAGPDNHFHPATARIDGTTIVLGSPRVQTPLHARYAWFPYPSPPVNLTNSENLPASPFTTELRSK